jgi:ADP-heptose:LPS heptosyltransferase
MQAIRSGDGAPVAPATATGPLSLGRPQDEPPRILLIRFKSIGDVIFTLPAVWQIRQSFPDAKIVYLTASENAALLQGFSELDRVVEVDRGLYRQGNPLKILQATARLLRGLRREKFELAVDLQGYVETAALTWWSGAPQRWGTVYNKGRRWAYTRGVTRDGALHPAEWNLALLRQCGLRPGKIRNEFVLPDSALNEARLFFAGRELALNRPTLYIQPFTSAPHKTWPLDRYLAVARYWQHCGLQILFSGGPGDRAALEPAREAGFQVSAGAPLLVAAGLMKLSTLILGGDTGLLHLAVAMNQRVVMIMGSVGPGSCHPFQHPDWALVPPPGQPVSSIPTDAVSDACARAFAGLGASVRS